MYLRAMRVLKIACRMRGQAQGIKVREGGANLYARKVLFQAERGHPSLRAGVLRVLAAPAVPEVPKGAVS